MSIADYLTSIANSKQAIKTSIKNKGVSIDDSTALSDYASKIDSITGGGGSDTRGKMLTAFINGDTVDIDDADITQISNLANVGNVRTLNIPGVTNLASYALKNDSGLETVDVSNVTSIGAYTFSYCSKLKTISMPAVTSFGYASFVGCTSLTTVSIGPGIKGMNAALFKDCGNITTITIERKQDAISGAPWGATGSNIKVNWTGDK